MSSNTRVQDAKANAARLEAAMRKVAIVIGIIILLIIVAGVVFAATFDVNKYRGTIQSEIEKRLGRQVTLGDMHLSLLPPSFRVQSLAIADDPRLRSEKPFVQAQELDVTVKLLDRKSTRLNSSHVAISYAV